MPSRFTQYGTAVSVDDTLREMVAARIAAEMEARKRAVEDYKVQQDDQRIGLAKQQEQRVADLQNKTFEDLALNREATRVNSIVDDSMPGDKFDPATAALIQKHGRGGVLRTNLGREAHGVLDVQGAAPTPQSFEDYQRSGEPVGVLRTRTTDAGAPTETVSRGGSRYLAGREAAADRAAAQSAQIAAQNERAAADRELRETIARLQAAGTAESRALANQLKELQIKSEQDKLAATQKEREKTEGAARETTQSAYELASRLLDPNDVGKNIGAATGAYELRGFTQGAKDFNAIRDQLVAALAMPNLGQLKGPMSDKDIVFIKQLATRLQNRDLSDAETIKALKEAQTFLQNKGATPRQQTAAGGMQPPPAPPGWKYVPKPGGGWTAVEDN